MEKDNNAPKNETNTTKNAVKLSYRSIWSLGFKVMGQIVLGYLLCLIFFTIISFTNNLAANIILQIIQMLIIFAFPYAEMWYEGDRIRNLVKFNHVKYDRLRGLKVGVISAIPQFISYGILLIAYFFQSQNTYIVYRILNIPFLKLIMALAGESLNTVFVGDLRWYNIIFLLVIPIFIILPSVVGIELGYRRISVLQKITFKDSKKIKEDK